jgi:hypothetical protein
VAEAIDLRRLVWAFIKEAPKMPNGGERVGEATSNVERGLTKFALSNGFTVIGRRAC